MSELANYLDSQGRITEWPSLRNKGKFQQIERTRDCQAYWLPTAPESDARS